MSASVSTLPNPQIHSSSSQTTKLGALEQLLTPVYPYMAITLIILATIPFDSVWLIAIEVLAFKILEHGLKGKPKTVCDVAFGIFYGIIGANFGFLQSNPQSIQKSFFFILFSKYERNSSLSPWITLLTSACFSGFLNMRIVTLVMGSKNAIIQLWIPFLLLLAIELTNLQGKLLKPSSTKSCDNIESKPVA